MNEYESGNVKVTIAHLDELKRSMPEHAHALERLADAGGNLFVSNTPQK